MKKLIFLFAIVAVMLTGYDSHAQVARGPFGTFLPTSTSQMNTYNAAGTSKNPGKDTLSNADTGYVWIGTPFRTNKAFDFMTTVLTGTVATTANVLQGSNDGSSVSSNWYTVTGNTTNCASCVATTATVTPTGSATHYVWQLPGDAATWKYYRIRTIQTGTATATYTGSVTATW